ncbi:MAG: hypothetical protein V3W41_06785 [Planctomycetota bacterium]
MTRQCYLLHPDGPDARALVAFLVREGLEVKNLTSLDSIYESCRAAGIDSDSDIGPSIVIHASFLRAPSPPADAPDLDRLCVLCPTKEDENRAKNWAVGLTWPEPYQFHELSAQLAQLAKRPRRQLSVSAAATACEPPIAAPLALPLDPDRQSAIMGALGAAFSPRVAAAEGWLQLLLQDIATDDPAHRHISHTLRELREIDRIVRLLRSHRLDRRVYIGPVRLNALLREIIGAQGTSAIPLSLNLAKDLPEVRADTRLLRSALTYLLRAALEPASRSRSLSWSTRAHEGQVILEFVEEGHRLTSSQLEALAAPGLSLLYNPVERGLGYPIAVRNLERCGIGCDVSAEPGRRLRIELKFECVGHGSLEADVAADADFES